MNESKLLNATIEIVEQTIKPGQYGSIAKLKGSDNHTYTVYQMKQDNTVSKAWETMMTLKQGETIQVGYVEKPGEYQGKSYISRIVRAINTDIGNGVRNHAQENGAIQTTPQMETLHSEAKTALIREDSEAFGRRLAIHGFANALLSSGKTIDEVTKMLPDLLNHYALKVHRLPMD